jgi:hypothetical protein
MAQKDSAIIEVDMHSVHIFFHALMKITGGSGTSKLKLPLGEKFELQVE